MKADRTQQQIYCVMLVSQALKFLMLYATFYYSDIFNYQKMVCIMDNSYSLLL